MDNKKSDNGSKPLIVNEPSAVYGATEGSSALKYGDNKAFTICVNDDNEVDEISYLAEIKDLCKKIEKMTLGNKSMVDEIVDSIKTPAVGIVSNIEKKKVQRHASAPFTTSTLQQEAARKLRFSSKRTMATAQKLYEQGFITYMRTDATNLSNEAVAEIREYIKNEYGDKFLPKSANVYITKSKNAQEAHDLGTN